MWQCIDVMYVYLYVQVVGLINSNNLVNFTSILLYLTFHSYIRPIHFASVNVYIFGN